MTDRGRRWGVVLGLVVVYVVTARLGLLLALPPEKKATAVWVPSGVALAAVLLYGPRLWPGVWLGALLANVWDGFTPANVAVSCGIATGSTVQALAGRVLLRRWAGTGSPFERTATAFAFAGTAMAMCLVAATFGVASLYLGGFAPAKALAFIWWTWWLGDMTGVLTAGSLILAWSRLPTLAWEPRRLAEAAFLLVLLVLLGVGVFGVGPFDFHVPAPLAYLTIPVLVWATFRFGLHGATAALVLISGIAVWGTSEGDGPFAQPTVQASLLLLQVYTGVIAVTALVMAAMLAERQGAEAEAKKSDTRYRLLLEGVPQLVWTCRPDGWCDYLSRQWVEYTGIPEADQLGYRWSEVVHPDDRGHLMVRWQQSVSSGDRLDVEFRIRGGAGGYRWFTTRAVRFTQDDGSVKWFGTNTDIHDKKVVEEQLREWNATLELRVAERTEALRANEERFKTLAGDVPVGIFETDVEGNCLFVNARWCEMAGMTPAAASGRGWVAALHPDDRKRVFREWFAATAEGREFVSEYRFRTPQGEVTWLTGRAAALGGTDRTGGYIGSLTDITERKLAEEQVKNSLLEKETLLKEIHHRVKNNLQIVSALLDLQSGHTTDAAALAMFRESRGRVRSMALIHEQLYRSNDLARVGFARYARQLAADVFRAYKVSDDDILLTVTADESPLPLDIAVPCGLLLNELISNCLKHAFPSGGGEIRIGLTAAAGGVTVLSVADTGVGFPAGVDFRSTTSFGLQLIHTLVEQLDGSVELRTAGGTEFVVTFPSR